MTINIVCLVPMSHLTIVPVGILAIANPSLIDFYLVQIIVNMCAYQHISKPQFILILTSSGLARALCIKMSQTLSHLTPTFCN